MTEQEIKNSILDYLSWKRECFVWPNDSVGIYDPIRKIYRKKNSKFHIRGVSDILGIFRERALAIEVKTQKGKVSPEQLEFISKFNKSGGIAFVARSVEDVERELK